MKHLLQSKTARSLSLVLIAVVAALTLPALSGARETGKESGTVHNIASDFSDFRDVGQTATN